METDSFVCAVSGIAAEPADHSDEREDDLPVGWSRVTVTTRRENPDHDEINDALEALVEQQLSMIPESDEAAAQREAARPMARIISRATFASLQAATPRYVYDVAEVVVSEEQLPKLAELLGIGDDE